MELVWQVLSYRVRQFEKRGFQINADARAPYFYKQTSYRWSYDSAEIRLVRFFQLLGAMGRAAGSTRDAAIFKNLFSSPSAPEDPPKCG